MKPFDYNTCPLNELTKTIMSEVYKTYFMYGPGLFERIYEATLAGRLRDLGIPVERQKTVHISNAYVQDEPAFKADLVVANRIILELKSVEKVHPVTYMQLRSYLKLLNIEVGFVINFNTNYLKNDIKRIVANYDAIKHKIA